MKLRIEINCDNAAFLSDPVSEVARIMGKIVEELDPDQGKVKVRDINGNVVGYWELG